MIWGFEEENLRLRGWESFRVEVVFKLYLENSVIIVEIGNFNLRDL